MIIYLFIYILSKNYLIHQIVAQRNLYTVLYVCIGSYVFFPVLANVSVFKAKRLAQRTSIAKKIYLHYTLNLWSRGNSFVSQRVLIFPEMKSRETNKTN